MKEAEKILEKFARKNMIEWNQESFKRTHPKLHRTIIETINEALNLPNVVKTSAEWIKEVGYEVLNPDGWDRSNFDYSWNKEKITMVEFQRRLAMSTVKRKFKAT